MMYRRGLVVLCVVVGAGAGSARATTVLSDDFSYANGELQTVSSSKWTRSGAALDLLVTAGRVAVKDNSTDDATATFSSTVNSGVLYAALTYTPDSADRTSSTAGSEYLAHFVNTGGTGIGRLFPGVPGGTGSTSIKLGVSNSASSSNVFFPTDLAVDVPHLAVMKFDFTAGQTTLWVDPVNESSTSVTATDTVATVGTLNRFGLRQPSTDTMGDGFVDNLRVASTFAEVVPEPTTALLVLPLAGLLLSRHRRGRRVG